MKKDNKIVRPGRKKLKTGDLIFNIFNYSFFIIFTIICIFPFYYLIINTISDNDLSSRGLINLIPRGIHFKNYKEVFRIDGFMQSTMISIARTVIGTNALFSVYLL